MERASKTNIVIIGLQKGSFGPYEVSNGIYIKACATIII